MVETIFKMLARLAVQYVREEGYGRTVGKGVACSRCDARFSYHSLLRYLSRTLP